MNPIAFEKAKELITANEYACVRAFDPSGHLLLMYDATSCADLIGKLSEMSPVFASCGVVTLHMADKFNNGNGTKNGVKWKVNFADPSQPVQVHNQMQPFSATNQLMEMLKAMQLMQTISGTNNQGTSKDYIDLQLKMQEQKYLHEIEKLKADKKGIEQYLPAVPFVLSALGKTPLEIRETMGLAALANQGTIAGTPATITGVTIEDIKKLSEDEKNAQIEINWQELTTKLSAEQMLMLLITLNKKPELADKAIQLVAAGMI